MLILVHGRRFFFQQSAICDREEDKNRRETRRRRRRRIQGMVWFGLVWNAFCKGKEKKEKKSPLCLLSQQLECIYFPLHHHFCLVKSFASSLFIPSLYQKIKNKKITEKLQTKEIVKKSESLPTPRAWPHLLIWVPLIGWQSEVGGNRVWTSPRGT